MERTWNHAESAVPHYSRAGRDMQAGGWAGREAYYTCYSHMYLLYTIFNFTLSNIEHLICHRLSGDTSTYWNVLFLFLAKLKKSGSYI